MADEKWQKVREIFDSALRQEPDERRRFINEVCGDDKTLLAEVKSLLSSFDSAESFMETPAVAKVAAVIEAETKHLERGETLGHYEIIEQIGEGGMGEVYLAKDTHLERKIALKILPESVAQDGERMQRFVREAKSASALNHPNIITIYEIGETDNTHFIATEYIEGETLRKRLKGSPLNLKSALEIASQVAGALDAAHRAGIVHRDVKPENVMVRPDGLVKLLDFGIAKLAEKETNIDSEAAIGIRAQTSPGMIIGTAAYMSPEQARGSQVDTRTDIFSFGVMLYEMLAGRPPFVGENAIETIGSILNKEPVPLSRQMPDVPHEIERIINKALRKDREERYQTAKDLLIDLKDVKQDLEFQDKLERSTSMDASREEVSVRSGEQATFASTDESTRQTEEVKSASGTSSVSQLIGKLERKHAGVLLALAALVIAGIAFGLYKFINQNRSATSSQTKPVSTETAAVLKTTQITSWSGLDIFPAISPDGNSIAYSSDHQGSFEIYVKSFTPGAREVQLTSDGGQNFEAAWSPDGKMIAYYSKMRRGIWVVPAQGGNAKQLTEFGSYPAWSPDGAFIAFQSGGISDDIGAMGSGALWNTTLWTIPSQGGEAKQITQVGNPPGGHGNPSWSPDGRHITFTTYDPAKTEAWSVSVGGDDLKRIAGGIDSIYSPDGKYIYFVSFGRNSLDFGLSKIQISATDEPLGEPVQIATTGTARPKRLSISADGKKISYGALTLHSNLWMIPLSARTNEATGPAVALTRDTSHRNSHPAVSSDGRKIAYHVLRVGSKPDIWMMDADGKNQRQLTTDLEEDFRPSWFPDGEQVAFVSNRQGKDQIWAINIKTGRERLLFNPDQDITFPRISPDGKQIVFNSKKGGTTNLWLAQIDSGEVKQLTFDKEAIGFPCWSPDGKFLAFEIKRGDNAHIGIMPSAGGEILQLTFEHGQSWPHSFSPDGEKIAFAGFRDGLWNTYWVSRDGKTQKRVTNHTKPNAFVRYPAWSPLGDKIVYEYTETTGNVWMLDLK
jgi:Tol biopolymer transport system component/predicted Ser/Thr protein kinase